MKNRKDGFHMQRQKKEGWTAERPKPQMPTPAAFRIMSATQHSSVFVRWKVPTVSLCGRNQFATLLTGVREFSERGPL